MFEEIPRTEPTKNDQSAAARLIVASSRNGVLVFAALVARDIPRVSASTGGWSGVVGGFGRRE